jgi:predicted anti-sigma-YlaC factor YlaD
MSACEQARELLGRLLEGELADEERQAIEQHLAGCAECRETRETLELVRAVLPSLEELEPPPQLAYDLAASPCRRWLGLLHQAVDHEIDNRHLERLLSHLAGCAACRQAWNDLTLIRQVSDALEPPPGLLERCIEARRRVIRRPVLSRRAATAAAYLMAVLASLMVGNPVSIARSPVVQRVTTAVSSEVSEVTEDGKGEVRVMIWRAWQWAERQLAAIADVVQRDDADDTSNPEQGGAR